MCIYARTYLHVCVCECGWVCGCICVYVCSFIRLETYIASYHEGHSDELSAQPLLCLGMPGCVMYVCVLVCMCIREYLYLYVCEFSM